MTNLYARHDRDFIAQPDVVADDGIAFVGQIAGLGRGFFPAVAEDVEGVGGETFVGMVGAVHDELAASGDGAEFADDEFVADKGEVVQDVAFEVLGVFWIVVVGVVADLDVGVGDGVFDEADLGKSAHGVF